LKGAYWKMNCTNLANFPKYFYQYAAKLLIKDMVTFCRKLRK